MKAQELVNELSSLYERCTSYYDKGSLFRWNDQSEKTNSPQLRFQTYYLKPFQFRFEWRDSRQVGVILGSRQRVIVCINHFGSAPSGMEFESIPLAIVAVTGISSTSSLIVPSLLMDISEMQRTSELRFLSDPDLESIGNLECICLRGAEEDEPSLWISSHDKVLRRYKRHTFLEKSYRSVSHSHELVISHNEDFGIRSYIPDVNWTVVSRRISADIESEIQTRSGRGYYTEINYDEVHLNEGISESLFESIDATSD